MATHPTGESSQLSLLFRNCAWCGTEIDISYWPRWKANFNTRFCGTQCACAHNSHIGWQRRSHRRTMWSASTLTNDERNRTRARTRTLIRRGELTVPKRCMRCNAKGGRLETHHVDYADPANVRFLCKWCHQVENSLQRQQFKHATTVTPVVSVCPTNSLTRKELA